MAHNNAVSKAIQAALNDIKLLRALVNAADVGAADSILRKYNPPIKLNGADLDEFWNSLNYGMMTMDARTLVDYYDSLQPPSRDRMVRGKPQEWTP